MKKPNNPNCWKTVDTQSNESENGQSTVENNLVLSPKVEHSHTLQSSNYIPAQGKFLHMCMKNYV